MTSLEKDIYNMWRSTSRKELDKPFKYRQNFDKFEDDPKYKYVKKISNIFIKFPHIKMSDYFKAPFKVYTDTDAFYDIKFYASLKGISCYKQYIKMLEMQSPDEAFQLEFIDDSFRFILKFCMTNHITIEEYLDYKLGVTYAWMQHYNNRQISIYSLLEFKNIYDRIVSMESEHMTLLLGDLNKRFYTIRNNYQNSNAAKALVKKGTALLIQKQKQK